MPDNLAGAKYFYKTRSIYFNADFPLESCITFATHECLHHLQEILDNNGNLVKLGLYDLKTDSGMALNEACVQLMTAESFNEPQVEVKYYDLNMKTASPVYYPLECVLAKQIAYFTGTYPLYHSTLFGDDIFKNTFVYMSDEKTFYFVINSLDKLLWLESELDHAITALQEEENSISKSKKIYKNVENIKKQITQLFLKTQNRIISYFFSNEFARIKTLENVKDFQRRLYEFKELIGSNSSYEFYNEFYRRSMDALEKKKAYIESHGELGLQEELSTAVTVVGSAKGAFSLWRRILARIRIGRARDELL